MIILLHYQSRGKIIGRCPVCSEPYSETEKLETYPDYFIEHGRLWEDANSDYQRILPLEKMRYSTSTGNIGLNSTGNIG